MKKESIAIFNPQDPLEQGIQEAYHSRYGRYTIMGETKAVVQAIIGYPHILPTFIRHPESVSNALFADKLADNVYVPCHQLELRQILRSKTIISEGGVLGVPYSTAMKLFRSYEIFLVFDRAKIKPVHDLDGIIVFDRVVEIGNALVKVLTTERLDSVHARQTQRIVKEEHPLVDVYPASELPGIAASSTELIKAAQIRQQKYVINIPALGITDELHSADNPREAVNIALYKRWRATKNPHRDPKFTVQYWEQSGFWEGIVRPANQKHAQVTEQQVHLTPKEQQIFQLLLQVNQKYNLGLTFRVAGGWVRDKLLNKDSDDIDIALDKMTGAQFGDYLMKELGHGGHVIKANPDQSKHLETMTISIYDQQVDFVNLRSETYGDSRIPQMRIGSPKEDAERRDLTINALFYNVNTGQVEDYTGHGVEDLKSMTLRTPLDPVKTFMDDPLRILRMLRFYSRYDGSQIDPASIEAMKRPDVQDALKAKVSPERIYKEWQKMFAGAQPSAALRILQSTGLWDKVFAVPEMQGFSPFTMDQNSPYHKDNVFDHTLNVIDEYKKILEADGAGKDEQARQLMAAFFHDLGKLDPKIKGIKEKAEGQVHSTYHGHEDVSAVMSRAILSALKASNEEIAEIEKVVQYHMVPHQENLSDKYLRKLLRDLGMNLLSRIVQHAKADAMASTPGRDVSQYDTLLNRVRTLQPSAPVGNVRKPVLSGDVIMAEFPGLQPKSGYIRDIQNRLQEMKDENPNLTDEQALVAVRQMKPEIEQLYGMQSKTIQQASWYNLLKESAQLKTAEAERLCGTIRKRLIGLYDERPTLIIDIGETQYKVRLAGDGTQEDTLESLLGKKICAIGIVHDGTFTVSKFNVVSTSPEGAEVLMKREKAQEMLPYNEGDRVRKRQVGVAFKPIKGTVKKIDNNLMYIKWDDVEDMEVFKVTDTVAIHALIEKL